MLRNSDTTFGKLTIAVHWLSALVVVGQFSFGLYMLSLDYYDPNYQVLPHYHKSIGILFAAVLLFRILWSLINPSPSAVKSVKAWEHRIAKIIQKLMLGLLVITVGLGYLISTATGDSIEVFNWFEIPATITSIENQEDIAGELHYWFALSIIIIASLHALAALKHHFIDKDKTLLRMLGKP